MTKSSREKREARHFEWELEERTQHQSGLKMAAADQYLRLLTCGKLDFLFCKSRGKGFLSLDRISYALDSCRIRSFNWNINNNGHLYYNSRQKTIAVYLSHSRTGCNWYDGKGQWLLITKLYLSNCIHKACVSNFFYRYRCIYHLYVIYQFCQLVILVLETFSRSNPSWMYVYISLIFPPYEIHAWI